MLKPPLYGEVLNRLEVNPSDQKVPGTAMRLNNFCIAVVRSVVVVWLPTGTMVGQSVKQSTNTR